jgi:flagellar secretion chaperone FliS
MNTYTAPPKAYQQSSVLTATPERLIVMLYDGMHRFLFQAAAAMRSHDIATSHTRLRQAESILVHLQSTLDLEQGEIAQNLLSIYLFCRRHLNEARVELNAAKVDEVDALLSTLREAWDKIC